ncbi:MAG: hypothetical protein RL480_1104 [Pseudomonadota bacterium]
MAEERHMPSRTALDGVQTRKPVLRQSAVDAARRGG